MNEPATPDSMRKLNSYFESKVKIPKIKLGNRQTVETLSSKEALLLARFLRERTRELDT